VHHCEHDDLVADGAEIDGVGKSPDEGSACVSVNGWISRCLLEYGCDSSFDCGGKLLSQADALPLVPRSRIE
jgi:hypothetical protein